VLNVRATSFSLLKELAIYFNAPLTMRVMRHAPRVGISRIREERGLITKEGEPFRRFLLQVGLAFLGREEWSGQQSYHPSQFDGGKRASCSWDNSSS
jgi:hypothetical protein